MQRVDLRVLGPTEVVDIVALDSLVKKGQAKYKDEDGNEGCVAPHALIGCALHHGRRLPAQGGFARGHDLIDAGCARQVRRFEFKFEEFDGAGRLVRERVVPLAMRYVFYDELLRLLAEAGLAVEAVYRDYERHAYDGTGEMIAVCRRV